MSIIKTFTNVNGGIEYNDSNDNYTLHCNQRHLLVCCIYGFNSHWF